MKPETVLAQKRRHVAVIGAGVGGLVAAIDLALLGHRVSLFEAHSLPGGKIHQSIASGQAMDSGPTVFTLRRVFDELYARAGRDFADDVGLTKAGLLARHSWIGSEPLDLYDNVEQSCEAIATLAGQQEADNYRRFAERTASVFNTLDDTFMRAPLPGPFGLTLAAAPHGVAKLLQTAPFKTLWRSLCQDFDDPRLRQLFGRYATYCGSSPFQAPSTLALIAHAERAGVWALKGGMQTLASSLAALAEAVGCECHYNQSVTRIHVENTRTKRVVLADERAVDADAVVFNGDVQALHTGLLGQTVHKAVKPRPRAAVSAVTHCLHAEVRGFDLSHHTVFFNDDYRAEFDALFTRQQVPVEPTVYVCAQDRSPGKANGSSSGKAERIFCLINAPARDLDDDETQRASTVLSDMLQRHGLELAATEPAVVTQPADFARRFPASHGALYGRPTHGWFGSFQRPGSRSRVAGLYLAGGTVHPGAGVPMAAMSGRLAAEAVNQDLG